MERDYLRPLPTCAAVHSLSLEIGERRVEAQIQRKETAQKVSAQAR